MCFDAASWGCELCSKCTGGCKGCGPIKCGSCKDRCRANLQDDCASGCSKLCAAIVNIQSSILDGGCDILKGCEAIVDAAVDAYSGILSGVESFAGGVLTSFLLKELRITVTFDKTRSSEAAQKSFNLQMQTSVYINYVHKQKERTIDFTVSLADITDLVKQFANKLYDDIVGEVAKIKYAFKSSARMLIDDHEMRQLRELTSVPEAEEIRRFLRRRAQAVDEEPASGVTVLHVSQEGEQPLEVEALAGQSLLEQ